MSSRNIEPEHQASDLHGSQKGRQILGIARRNAAPTLEMQKGIFNQVALPVEMSVVFTLRLPVLSRRDDRLHPPVFCFLNNGIAVVTLVGNQVLCLKAINQCVSLRAIRSGSLCSNNSDRHTMRIHGQVYLGVEPPFVRLIP